MSINKTTTDIDVFKINYLTQEMYDAALANNQINGNELYITPNEAEFTIENNYETLCEESITLQQVQHSTSGARYLYAEFNYLNFITSDILKITFLNTDYICAKQTYISERGNDTTAYGSTAKVEDGLIDWSKYPIRFVSQNYSTEGWNRIYVDYDYLSQLNDSGVTTIKIEALTSSSVTTSSNFRAAVNYVINSMKVEGGSY